MERDTGIILSADVKTLSKLRSLLVAARGIDEITGVKIGCTLCLRFGMETVVEAIRGVSDIDVIYDHQKAGTDVPQMGVPFAEVCKEAKVDAVIIFPQAGPATLVGYVTALQKVGLRTIVGLTMTHPAYLESEGGWIDDGAPLRIAAKAVALGVDAFVLPGNKTGSVEEYAGFLVSKAMIMMPGIGTQGGDIASAFAVASPHKRRAIIGSKIYNAENPRAAMQAFAAQVAAA